MEKLKVEFVDFENIVVNIVVVFTIVEQDMIVMEIYVENNTVQKEIVHRDTTIVGVGKMEYFQNCYFSNLVSKVDLDFEWGMNVVEHSMIVH